MVVRERLCVELGAIRWRWDDWCARRGVTAGEGVRQLIATAIRDDAESGSGTTVWRVPRPIVGEPRHRIEIRLTSAELNAVERCAAAMGLRSNRWIVSLVRAQLTREPQLGVPELSALCVSNQRLAEIGRLLGQLAHADETEPVPRDLMCEWAELRERVDEHLRTAAAIMRANLDRWSR
ncbi:MULTISPECIES: plasmid stabilization protein [Burkholderia cepacia complex]|uniref:Plasmid stabilization protein n=2 Tax=Burkholderia cepacia complex TaxID=87882 RepID=A0A8A8DDS8_9BURK|nr:MULTISPECIES: plasmid stabilization protein [Burkholderia cepacia complex]QTO23255.1 plasmid stabilization protein [Burkholderia seminalis]TES81909.1 plasmid stabilization protein [Burkholderia cepacia]TEU40241.1 plasmid stabilization protein [Burkholderia cepacia]TEU53989.1 plasmid stabilization protein [Burkholderia cepacia]TEU57908.1 plasmid stabilization protein [Burkholderia cepacia]